MVPEADNELELRDYLRVLQRRKWTIVLVALLVVASAVIASATQTPIYRSSADILLQARTTESLFDPTVAQAVSRSDSAPTEIRVLESEPVRRLVEAKIGSAPKVSVTNPAETDFLVVSAESSDPERAATVANAYANAYVEFRRSQAVTDIEAAITQLEERVAEIDAQLAAGSPPAPSRATTTTQPVDASLDSLQRNRDLYVSRIDQLRLAATQKTGGAQVVTPAEPSETPVRPTPLRNAVVAFFVGVILGVGLAFLRDYLDDSLKTKEDVERAIPGVPVLGLIPQLGGWKDRKAAVVISMTDPKSPAAEAYRTLRTSVQFLGLERPLKIIQVSSASASEGKSTTIANLAVALAGAGRRVVLVDADLRRPRIHNFFGLSHDVGLTSVLLGQVSLPKAIKRVPNVDGLYLLPSGPIPPNPSEVLASDQCGQVLADLAASCDMVLIDCPPVLPVTDASVLAHRVDGTLLVATAQSTERRQLHRAVELLNQVNAPLLGVVFNGVSDEAGYGYSYGYRYAYAPEPETRRNKPKRGSAVTQGGTAPEAIDVPRERAAAGRTEVEEVDVAVADEPQDAGVPGPAAVHPSEPVGPPTAAPDRTTMHQRVEADRTAPATEAERTAAVPPAAMHAVPYQQLEPDAPHSSTSTWAPASGSSSAYDEPMPSARPSESIAAARVAGEAADELEEPPPARVEALAGHDSAPPVDDEASEVEDERRPVATSPTPMHAVPHQQLEPEASPWASVPAPASGSYESPGGDSPEPPGQEQWPVSGGAVEPDEPSPADAAGRRGEPFAARSGDDETPEAEEERDAPQEQEAGSSSWNGRNIHRPSFYDR